MSRGARRSRRQSQVLRIKIFLAAGILALAFVLIFSTETIHVAGNEHVSGAEVRAMIEEQPVSWNTALLFLYNKVRPVKDQNFIGSVSIRMTNPHTVIADVHEKQLAGYIAANGKYWYFDRNGVIEACADRPETTAEGRTYIPLIGGLTAGSPAIGDSMPAADTGLYERLGNLQTVLSRDRLLPDTIYVDEDYDVYMTYGRVTVEMGDLEYLEARMSALADILPSAEGMEGTLLLGEYEGGDEGVVFRRRDGAPLPAKAEEESGEVPGEETEETEGTEQTEETEEETESGAEDETETKEEPADAS